MPSGTTSSGFWWPLFLTGTQKRKVNGQALALLLQLALGLQVTFIIFLLYCLSSLQPQLALYSPPWLTYNMAEMGARTQPHHKTVNVYYCPFQVNANCLLASFEKNAMALYHAPKAI